MQFVNNDAILKILKSPHDISELLQKIVFEPVPEAFNILQ
jgi:hypothetical protein